MENWTTEQVAEWLNKEGFEQFIQRFKDQNVNGMSLLNLSDEAIRQLFFQSDKSERRNQKTMKHFKQKLQEWRIENNANGNNRKIERLSTTESNLATATSSKDRHESYTKHFTLSTDIINTNIKFFNNSLFCTNLQRYLLNTYDIDCQIQLLETSNIDITLTGIKQHVKAARQTIMNLFESTRIKIFDQEDTYRQIIYWSKHIISDLMIPVIQQIMDHQHIFTLWEKTAMFSGYLKVIYFTHESFTVAETYIAEILNNEIAYIENIIMPKEKTKQFLDDIEEFITNKQQSQLAIIRCKYPYKLDVKISLFGRKNSVKKVKKHLQSIINKHTMKIVYLKLNSIQHEYLVDNCLEQLKDIENQYKDDCVKIRIRFKEFSAPQYLVEQIKQKINELIVQTFICQYQKIGNTVLLTDDMRKEFNEIAKRHYCRIVEIEAKLDTKIYSIPKALSPTSSASTLIMQQSNEFYSSLSMRRIVVLNGSIEIYLTNQSSSISRDITIISSRAGAAEENIEYMNNDGYLETNTHRKFLFLPWSPATLDNAKTDKKLRKFTEKFIFSALQMITTYCYNVEKIAFLTNEWDHISIPRQQQLATNLINGIKQELEIRKTNWRILFFFNNQQTNFYQEFYQVFIRLQTDRDGFAQFSSPVSIIRLTLTSSSNFDQTRCENEMNDYVQKHSIVNKTLSNEIDLSQWDQHMINVFYNYCLNNSILPNINLINNSQINLIGSIIDVEKAIEKCKLMSEILKQKSSIQIPAPTTPRTSIKASGRLNQIDRDGYNMYFSYCQHDQNICDRIMSCLMSEGYCICQTSSNISLSQSQIDKSDILLIGFSKSYTKSRYSMSELNYGKSTRKKIIPFIMRKSKKRNSWLSSLELAEFFYELFDAEIDIEFNDDFDLEYDKLLSTLLHHTKPGVTGITYPQKTALAKITESKTDDLEVAFGHKSAALQKVTAQQYYERERVYHQQLTQRIQDEKIPIDEVNELVGQLAFVTDYLKEILLGNDLDTALAVNEQNRYLVDEKSWKLDENSRAYASELLDCINRWLDKSPNVMKKNIAPFTPTGDINDAIFIIHRSSNDQLFGLNYEPFDHSPPERYFSTFKSYPGSCFNSEQSFDYLQRIIKSTKPVSFMEISMEDNEIAWDTVSLFEAKNEDDDNEIYSEWKTPEEIRKLEELDNPNRIWTNTRNAEKFIRQKIKNILEFKELCEKWS